LAAYLADSAEAANKLTEGYFDTDVFDFEQDAFEPVEVPDFEEALVEVEYPDYDAAFEGFEDAGKYTDPWSRDFEEIEVPAFDAAFEDAEVCTDHSCGGDCTGHSCGGYEEVEEPDFDAAFEDAEACSGPGCGGYDFVDIKVPDFDAALEALEVCSGPGCSGYEFEEIRVPDYEAALEALDCSDADCIGDVPVFDAKLAEVVYDVCIGPNCCGDAGDCDHSCKESSC